MVSLVASNAATFRRARMSREKSDEGLGGPARMNSVLFAVIIFVLSLLSLFVIQRILDNPNS